ncbi:MAG: arylamine N-acetyltransferase [Acidimicrobiales bacterium]
MYLTRIGLAGAAPPPPADGAAATPRPADLDTLASVVAAHTATIPFENLTPLLGRRVRLEPEALQDKLVARRRGGYCFEHNLLLCDELSAMGFAPVGLAARVLWNAPGPVPRTHMLVRVGDHLVDCGFGGMTLTGVLALKPDVEQETSLEPFRLRRQGEWWTLQGLLPSGWRDVYTFTLEPQQRVDYELYNWYTSTHPASLFVNHLVVGRPGTDRRFALLDSRLTVHHLGGPSEERVLGDVAAIEATLTDVFDLDLSGLDGLREVLGRFV